MYPKFSIIIPTHERPRQLKQCLIAISRLEYPRDKFEVIVVDDGSRRTLADIVTPFETSIDVTLVRVAQGGPAAARNVGAMRAKGEYFAFTDDDCTPSPQWLSHFEREFHAAVQGSKFDQPASEVEYLLGGVTQNALRHNPYSTASQLLVDYLYQYYGNGHRLHFFTSNNFALSAQAFEKLQGFSESFPLAAGEDRDFCRRAIVAGIKLKLVPEAEVGHAHKLTMQRFKRQHFNYGKGAFHFYRHANRSTPASRNDQQRSRRKFPATFPRPEPVRFYRDLLLYPWAQGHKFKLAPHRKLHLTALLFLSQIYNLAGYVQSRISHRLDS